MPGTIRSIRTDPLFFLLVYVSILMFVPQFLFGLGKSDMTKQVPKLEKSESVIYICDVDVSQMPAELQIAGGRIRSALIQTLTQIKERTRSSVETERYKETLWQEQKNAAAKALAEARTNRDMLFFKGYSKQKYELELAKITATITDLEKKYTHVMEQAPVITEKARLVMHKDMESGNVVPAPERETWKKFCLDRNIDLLITSSLRELFGRWVLSYSIYRSVDDRVLYSDTVAFAPEELETVLPNIASVLYQGLSGGPPGAIKISAQPDSAAIVVHEAVAGRGTSPILEGPPGELSISVTHPGYYPISFTLERTSYELRTASISLSPMALHVFEIMSPNEAPLAVYIDGEYRGKTPFAVELPRGFYSLYLVKDMDGNEQESIPIILETQTGTLPIPDQYVQFRGEKPVEKARKQFYGAFGRFWIALPIAFLLNGIADTYIKSVNYGGSQDLIDPATKLYYSAQVAWLITGVFLGESLYRLGYYVYSANKGASPVLKPTNK